MNSLVIQTPTHAISSERSIRRVFLSYSHDDFELAATFVKYFKPVARRLGVDFFYDADRLRAGYRWEETLLRELRQSQLLIFLVSINSIDEDGYCMGTELRFAAEHGFPIVPVVLSECPWRDPPIPGDPHGATLDQWQVLPLRNGDIVPVTHWENRADQAWSTVVEGLREILEEDAPGPALVLPHRPAAAGRPPVDVKLLPYLCDQQPWLDGFDGGLLTWDERALVVLVKGQYRDN
ncbi:MAG TPA: TIR domain-containing protein, partial [Longimicrobium sp.]|nr:TIR domain-containing protein [Longimicrobium sp.]